MERGVAFSPNREPASKRLIDIACFRNGESFCRDHSKARMKRFRWVSEEKSVGQPS